MDRCDIGWDRMMPGERTIDTLSPESFPPFRP